MLLWDRGFLKKKEREKNYEVFWKLSMLRNKLEYKGVYYVLKWFKNMEKVYKDFWLIFKFRCIGS